MKIALYLVAVVACLFGGCREKAVDNKAKSTGGPSQLTEATVVLEGSATTLDPVAIVDVYSQFAANAIHAPLSFVTREGKLKLILADSLTLAEDARSCRITLRPESKFWDGSPVTARDVKASFERFRRSNHVHRWIFDLIEGVDAFDKGAAQELTGIKLIDEESLEVHFSQPEPEFLWFISSLATAITKAGSEASVKTPFGTNVIGAGPFKPTKVESADSFVFERNAGFPMPNHLQRLRFKVIENPQNQLEAQRRGEVQVTRLRGSMIQEACEMKDGVIALRPEFDRSHLVRVRANELLFLYFNWSSPVLSGIAESDRHALLKTMGDTIDRARAAKNLFSDTAIPSYSIIPPKVYLGEDAQSPHGGGAFQGKQNLTLYSANDAPSRAVATYIANQTSASIVQLEPQFLEPGLLVKNVLTKNFDAALLWIELQIPSKSPYPWLSFFSQGTAFTGFGQPLPEITDEVRKVRSIVSDDERRMQISGIVQEISKKQTAWLPLLSRDAIFLVDPNAGKLFLDYNATPVIGLLGVDE